MRDMCDSLLAGVLGARAPSPASEARDQPDPYPATIRLRSTAGEGARAPNKNAILELKLTHGPNQTRQKASRIAIIRSRSVSSQRSQCAKVKGVYDNVQDLAR
jgi:hypothetical protein